MSLCELFAAFINPWSNAWHAAVACLLGAATFEPLLVLKPSMDSSPPLFTFPFLSSYPHPSLPLFYALRVFSPRLCALPATLQLKLVSEIESELKDLWLDFRNTATIMSGWYSGYKVEEKRPSTEVHFVGVCRTEDACGLSQCVARWMDSIWPTLFAEGLFLSAGQQQKHHCGWECHKLYIIRTLHLSSPCSSLLYY